MAKVLDWTVEQWAEVLGYLANPKVEARLEIQVRPDGQEEFERNYRKTTWVEPPPPGKCGYSVLRPTSDKRGPQMRVYLIRNGQPPGHLLPLIKNGHHMQGRISRNALVCAMLKRGFLMGSTNLERIKANIQSYEEAAFRRGFKAGDV